MKPRRLGAVSIAAILLSGCATAVSGEAVPGDAPSLTSGSLPFTPTIAGRENERNDGTSFEPCTAYSPTELSSVGIDADSIRDAAFSDSPNYRGCRWGSATDPGLIYSQTVGNEISLERYKEKQSDLPWQADRVLNERAVALSVDPTSTGCFTVFMAEKGLVATMVIAPGKEALDPLFTTECEMAVTFTELATRKAPR